MQSNLNLNKKYGIIIIALVAGLIVSCAEFPHTSSTALSTDLAHCYGVKDCREYNCNVVDENCQYIAYCEGSEFVVMPSEICANIGGVKKDLWSGRILKADLIRCYDLKHCHDQVPCKDQEFVAMPAKACSKIGGRIGK